MSRAKDIKIEIDSNITKYSGKNNREISIELNKKTIDKVKSSISGDELFQQTDIAELSALTQHKQQLWVSFCSRSIINPGSKSNIEFVKFIYGNTSKTIKALNSKRLEKISRAEELGLGIITEGDVLDARS